MESESMCEVFTIDDIQYKEEPWCEHCGELEPYTATFEDGADWCIWCGLMGDLQLKEEDKWAIEVMEAKHKLKYFTERVESITRRLKELGELSE